MALARRCDRCDVLYESEFGCVSIEQLYVSSKRDPDTLQTWSDINFCSKCSPAVLDAIGPAIQDVKRPRRKP